MMGAIFLDVIEPFACTIAFMGSQGEKAWVAARLGGSAVRTVHDVL